MVSQQAAEPGVRLRCPVGPLPVWVYTLSSAHIHARYTCVHYGAISFFLLFRKIIQIN